MNKSRAIIAAKSKSPVKPVSGGYVMMPAEVFDQLVTALKECQEYFDYMGGNNHVSSRDARTATKEALKKVSE